MISVKWFNSLSSDSLLSEYTFSTIEYARDYIVKEIAPLLDADDRLVIEEMEEEAAIEVWCKAENAAKAQLSLPHYIENTANLWRR